MSKASGLAKSATWQLIELSEDFKPRFHLIVCALNTYQIVILGGINPEEQLTDETWVFNTMNDKAAVVPVERER